MGVPAHNLLAVSIVPVQEATQADFAKATSTSVLPSPAKMAGPVLKILLAASTVLAQMVTPAVSVKATSTSAPLSPVKMEGPVLKMLLAVSTVPV